MKNDSIPWSVTDYVALARVHSTTPERFRAQVMREKQRDDAERRRQRVARILGIN